MPRLVVMPSSPFLSWKRGLVSVMIPALSRPCRIWEKGFMSLKIPALFHSAVLEGREDLEDLQNEGTKEKGELRRGVKQLKRNKMVVYT